MADVLWSGRRAPFTLLGGYLGAGKTTILNHVIRHAGGRRLAVLVNDIGAVSVDDALIADHDGRTLSLTNGCVCCSIADDLGPALEEIRSLSEPPDHVVMELSGVADPARVASWGDTAGFRLDGVVVLVDADQYADHERRRDIGDTVRSQVTAADVVLLTKTDLAVDGGRQTRDRVAACTSAPIVPVVDGEVDIDLLLGTGGTSLSTWSSTATPRRTAPTASADHDYRVSVRDVGDVTRAELAAFLDGLPSSVLRAKGVVRCVDVEHPVEVHVVGRRRRIRVRSDLRHADGALVVIER